MATGSVARFDVRRGYGFVIPDDGGEDVFVHQNNIIMDGFRYLKAGEHVSYELEVGEKGMKAVSVQLLDPRPPEPPREARPPRDSYRERGDSYRDERGAGYGSRNGGSALAERKDDGEVRRLRRKVERLISVLVERGVISPEDIDAVDNGFAAAHIPSDNGVSSEYGADHGDADDHFDDD